MFWMMDWYRSCRAHLGDRFNVVHINFRNHELRSLLTLLYPLFCRNKHTSSRISVNYCVIHLLD